MFCFDLSSLLSSSALTCDKQYLLVGDGNGSCIHLCQVRGRLKLRTISNIPGLVGIAVTDGGTVFLSSSKEHALFSLKEEEMLGGIETQHDHTSMHPTVLPHSARIAEQLY